MDFGVTFPSQKLSFRAKGDNQEVQKPVVYVVYQHTNKKTGFVYVGITKRSKNPNQRWRNGKAYHNSVRFYNSILKYGWDSFDHFCEYVSDKNLAIERERELIKFYKDLCISYNIAEGGEGSEAMSEETREKLRKYSPWIKGKHHTAEARKKISEAGRGRKVSEKVLSVLAKGRQLSYPAFQKAGTVASLEVISKPVLQIDKNTDEVVAEYPSAAAAERALCGRLCGHVSEVCLGRPKRKTYCGYKWRYKNGD